MSVKAETHAFRLVLRDKLSTFSYTRDMSNNGLRANSLDDTNEEKFWSIDVKLREVREEGLIS